MFRLKPGDPFARGSRRIRRLIEHSLELVARVDVAAAAPTARVVDKDFFRRIVSDLDSMPDAIHGTDMDDKDLYSGLIRLHVLYHACQGPIFGAGIIEELARPGYRLSPGSLYPLLHGLEEKGYLLSSEESSGRQPRRVYRATPKGRKAMAGAKVKVRELFSELLEDDRPEGSPLRKTTSARDLMKGLVIELRDGLSKAKGPKAQALLETSAAVIGGLIKAFDDYEKKSEE